MLRLGRGTCRPPPQGGLSVGRVPRGADNLQVVSLDSPDAATEPIAIHCPPPVEGAGGGAERAGSVLALQDLSIVTTGKHVLPGTWPLLHPGTGLRTTVDNVTLHPPEDARPTARRGGDPGRLIFQV